LEAEFCVFLDTIPVQIGIKYYSCTAVSLELTFKKSQLISETTPAQEYSCKFTVETAIWT
jgi:hypothetical protein